MLVAQPISLLPLKTKLIENTVNAGVSADKMQNLHVEQYGSIQPDFIAAMFEGDLAKEALEICAGHGFVVEKYF